MTDPTPNHPPIVTETPVPQPIKADSSRSKRQAFHRWVLRIALGLTILSPLVFVLAALGTKMGLWSWQFGLLTLSIKVGPMLLMIAMVFGLIALLVAVLIKPRKGVATAIFALLIPALCFGNLLLTKSKSGKLPAIHDITTDTLDPPTFGAAIMAERNAVDRVNTVDYDGKREKTNEVDEDENPVTRLVSALQTQAYPEIRTLVLSEAPDVAFGRAEQVARDLGWAIKETDVETGRIDATETTFWYGFKDDVTIRLRPAPGGGTRVDVRSISRVGVSDIGANAARIKSFLDGMAE